MGLRRFFFDTRILHSRRFPRGFLRQGHFAARIAFLDDTHNNFNAPLTEP
jgi:uncharacterized protein YifE (UPF0438 family)